MASIHKTSRSRYWFACFAGPDKKRMQLSTKHENGRVAKELAETIEKAARMARTGLLTPEKVQAIVRLLPPLDPEVNTKVRFMLNDFLSFSGEEPTSEITIRQWCQSWLSDQEGATATGSYKRYAALIKEFLAHLGTKADVSLRRLSKLDVQSFRDGMVNEGVSDPSANLALKTLRTCFGSAVDQGYCSYNRAKAVKLRHKGPKARGFKRPFTHQQVQALIAHAPSREWRELIICAYYLGDRLGNLVLLRIEQFNLDNGTLTYAPGKQKQGSELKTVVIPLHPILCAIVKGHARTRGFLFPTLSQIPVSGVAGLSLLFRKIMESAGIECDAKEAAGPRGRTVFSLGFHSLRRSFNSDLANSNVSQELRQKLIGHASKEVNDLYTSVELETLRDAIHKLPNLETKSNEKAS